MSIDKIKIYLKLIAYAAIFSLGSMVLSVLFLQVSLIGLRQVAPNFGLLISPYVGGLALSFLLVGFGCLGGFFIRFIFIFIATKNNIIKANMNLLREGVCLLLLGVVLAIWYASSLYFYDF